LGVRGAKGESSDGKLREKAELLRAEVSHPFRDEAAEWMEHPALWA
jgi:hypothetical protein